VTPRNHEVKKGADAKEETDDEELLAELEGAILEL